MSENEDLPADFRISAQIRIAAASGIPMMVVHKGHPTAGAIYLKINRLDGTAEVLSEIRNEGQRVWMRTSDKPMADREADMYLYELTESDPDLWVVEVEDKQGRHWFPEPILDF